MTRGSIGRVRTSTFETARAGASAGAALIVEDCTFSESRDAAVSANGNGSRVKVHRGTITRSPVSHYGVSAYKGGQVQLNETTLDSCRVAVRSLETGSQVSLEGCRVAGKRTKTVALAKNGGRAALVNTLIAEEVRNLSDVDEASTVEVVDA